MIEKAETIINEAPFIKNQFFLYRKNPDLERTGQANTGRLC
jgi:hypothetical protein